MQLDNSHLEVFLGDKENEKLNNVLNINPKKYPRILEEKTKNQSEGKNNQLKKKSSLLRPNSYEIKQYRDRRTKSISFADVSRFSIQEIYNGKLDVGNNNYSCNLMIDPNNKISNGNITRHRSYSSLNGTTTLARKRSFRKPKILINSKEHIRRLKKMKSISALSFKQESEENKAVKRRYSIHLPSSQRIYTYDDYDENDVFLYGSRIEESYSDLPQNTLYDELKRAREKELLEKQLERDNGSLKIHDEETVFYDSDSSFNDERKKDKKNNSILKLILKYLENSINNKGENSFIERDIKEEDVFDYSYISENSQFMDEESELYKQEEILESIFDDVVKNFYGYHTKFFKTILRLFSFLLYNGGRMKLGHHLFKFILDKLGINISSSSEDSYTQDINTIHNFKNDEMEFITPYEMKEYKRHEIRRKKGYQSIKKIWIIFHSVFIISFMFLFLIFHPSGIITQSSNINSNLININNGINHPSLGSGNIMVFNMEQEKVLLSSSSPVTWLLPNDNQQEKYEQCLIDSSSRNKIKNKLLIKKNAKRSKKSIKFEILIKKMVPWKTLVVLECILITAQLGFQYFIMDEIIPFFKPKLYTSVFFINEIINFFVQFKDIWILLYNDICLYLFILGIYSGINTILHCDSIKGI